MNKLQGYGLLWLLLAAGFMAGGSFAQNYPSRPIHINTAGTGGGPDLTARLMATELGGPLGTSMIVENRSAGNVLATAVAKAAPDGYTLLVWGGALWLGPLFEEAPYDTLRDFSSISALTRSPYILVVHPSVEAKTVAELIKLAKAQPGKLNNSSGPDGSSSHLAGEIFKSMAGVDIVRVAYKGGPQETIDLLSGQVQLTFASGASIAPQVKSGKMRGLGSAGARPSALFPDLPTVSETLPGFVSESLLGMWAPAKTPDAVIRRLNQETVKILDKPEVRARFLQSGAEAGGSTPEQLTESIRSEIARVSKIIKVAGPR